MSPVLRTVVFTIFVPGFWTILVPYWVAGRGVGLDLRDGAVAGWLLVAAGAALDLNRAFRRVAFRGKGPPAPIDLPTRLGAEAPLPPRRIPGSGRSSSACRAGR